MPLPWLIGAAVVGLIAAAVNSDDTSSSSSSSSSDEEERRRREAAAEQQRKNERRQKQENAQALFKERGQQIGRGLAASLDESMDVTGEPVFASTLSASGCSKRRPDQVVPNGVEDVLKDTFSDTDKEAGEVIRNLAFFEEVYDARLRGSTKLYAALLEIQSLDKDLLDLAKIRSQLDRIGKSKPQTTPNKAEAAQ
jgi:hypothetical protein